MIVFQQQIPSTCSSAYVNDFRYNGLGGVGPLASREIYHPAVQSISIEQVHL